MAAATAAAPRMTLAAFRAVSSVIVESETATQTLFTSRFTATSSCTGVQQLGGYPLLSYPRAVVYPVVLGVVGPAPATSASLVSIFSDPPVMLERARS